MLSELKAWFVEQLPNRRLYPRRRGPFRAWIRAEDEWMPLIGVDISAAGIGVLSLQPLPWGPAQFAAEIAEQRVEFAAHCAWLQDGMLEERRVWRGGFRTNAIGAQPWRTVLDFCNASLPPEQHVSQPPLLRIPPDDTERLLPKSLRERIVQMLVESERLVTLGAHPNLQFMYGGAVHFGGEVRHKLLVSSSAIGPADNRVHAYETPFFFDDEGGDVAMDVSQSASGNAAPPC